MRIIPVLDILSFEGRKHVVRGVKGERGKYLPIEASKLVENSNPIQIAAKFSEIGFKELYIADLDAIQDINKELDYAGKLIVAISLY